MTRMPTSARESTGKGGTQAGPERARAAGLVPGTWRIDPAHSEVAFVVRHLMTKVRGTFHAFSGELVVADDPTTSSARVEIETSSLSTGSKERDAHVRSGDFLAVERHPLMRFVSDELRLTGESTFALAGELTVKDVTRPIELEAEFLGVAPDLDGNTRAGFEAVATVDRTDFGVSANVPVGERMLIGEQVAIQISVQAVLRADPES